MTTASLGKKPSLRLPGIGRALLMTLLIGVSATVLAVVWAGPPQLAGALLGAGVVAAFFVFGMVNTAIAAAFAPRVALVVALATYTVQVVALALLLVTVSRSAVTPERLDVSWLAGTVIAGAVGWTVALVVDALRTPLPEPSDATSEGGASDGAVLR